LLVSDESGNKKKRMCELLFKKNVFLFPRKGQIFAQKGRYFGYFYLFSAVKIPN